MIIVFILSQEANIQHNLGKYSSETMGPTDIELKYHEIIDWNTTVNNRTISAATRDIGRSPGVTCSCDSNVVRTNTIIELLINI